MECVWELSASPGNRLTLTFTKFDLELSDKCNEDYVEIRENDISGKLIGLWLFLNSDKVKRNVCLF